MSRLVLQLSFVYKGVATVCIMRWLHCSYLSNLASSIIVL